MSETNKTIQLTDAQGLLEELWTERGRPSLSWLRQQQRRKVIPCLKVAGKVFFDPVRVREALDTGGQAGTNE